MVDHKKGDKVTEEITEVMIEVTIEAMTEVTIEALIGEIIEIIEIIETTETIETIEGTTVETKEISPVPPVAIKAEDIAKIEDGASLKATANVPDLTPATGTTIGTKGTIAETVQGITIAQTGIGMATVIIAKASIITKTVMPADTHLDLLIATTPNKAVVTTEALIETATEAIPEAAMEDLVDKSLS